MLDSNIIETFIADLTTLVKQEVLDVVLGALAVKPDVVVVPRPLPAKLAKQLGTVTTLDRPKRAKYKRSSPQQLAQRKEKVLAYIRTHPGKGGTEIRTAVKLDNTAWRLTTQALQTEKLIHTKGVKRNARWFLTQAGKKPKKAGKK